VKHSFHSLTLSLSLSLSHTHTHTHKISETQVRPTCIINSPFYPDLGRYSSVRRGFQQHRGRIFFLYERVLSQKCSLIAGAEVRLSRKLTNQKRHFIDFSRPLRDALFCFIQNFPHIKRLPRCRICSNGVTPAAILPFDP
jgi:hypothetical protein